MYGSQCLACMRQQIWFVSSMSVYYFCYIPSHLTFIGLFSLKKWSIIIKICLSEMVGLYGLFSPPVLCMADVYEVCVRRWSHINKFGYYLIEKSHILDTHQCINCQIIPYSISFHCNKLKRVHIFWLPFLEVS